MVQLKKLPYESKEVNLLAGEQHDPEYVKLNPNHVVPTLVTDNGVLIESNLIIEYPCIALTFVRSPLQKVKAT